MDLTKMKVKISEAISKYKYVCIVLIAGIIFMSIPSKSDGKPEALEQTTLPVPTEASIENQLEEILCNIQGAGKVKVMLTVAQGERTTYQTDSTYSQSEDHTDSRTQTVIITDDLKTETGLVLQRYAPVYQGAVVVAEGGDLPSVRLSIVEATSDVTGLGADRITVLKMG